MGGGILGKDVIELTSCLEAVPPTSVTGYLITEEILLLLG